MHDVQTGLEVFIQSPPDWIMGKRLGLLCNPASVDRHFTLARDLIQRCCPGQLKALLAPQHGFFADKQDNMIESDDLVDTVSNLPVFSLYGKTRKPTAAMMDKFDVLLIDLQDVGTRVYTFAYTISYCLEAARKYRKKVLILDRPNPINGITIEGNLLNTDYSSFVGRYPIPMRHGLTMGELAHMFNTEFGIHADLDVIKIHGWQREMLFNDTGLPWVAPSPNLPTPTSAMVYPGQVLWEGTNVSEGRGTTLPFEVFGAPFIDPQKILETVSMDVLSGAILRTCAFEPTANKWCGQLCRGFQIHITDPNSYQPFRTTILLLQAILQNHKTEFNWKAPPYEYEFEKQPIDLIIGDRAIRQRIEKLESIASIEQSWMQALQRYQKMSRAFHLY
ncbi:MAG: DUF1343 domain-containing protein [Desulfobacterales bacterium]|nr:DUF1343 domain-containing protein [Desulfobacterales bacterium]